MFAEAARCDAQDLRISIIIPTLNEAVHIEAVLAHLQAHCDDRVLEILVVDGGSDDGTADLAREAGATVLTSVPGRAQQMNRGAAAAAGNVLYFVHADTRPPAAFLDHIARALADGIPMGCFRFRFDVAHPLLRVNAYCTRFDLLMCRGGDQTLYIERSLFDSLGGYHEAYVIMEEYDLLRRARHRAAFIIMPEDVVVSARKYSANGYLRVNLTNLLIFTLFRLGVDPATLRRLYRRLLHPPPAAPHDAVATNA